MTNSDDDPAHAQRAGGNNRGFGEDSDAASSPTAGEQQDKSDHRAEAAEKTADLFDSGLKEYLADQLAERLGDRAFEIIDEFWTPEHCEMLAALADKLDQLYDFIRNGIATGVRIVVRWAGASDFTAALIGELVATSVAAHFLYPLKGFAELLRVTGTVCCAACGCAGSCACARSLTKDLLIRYLKWIFGLEVDRVAVSGITDRIIGPGVYFTYEYLRNGGSGDSDAKRRADEEGYWGPGWRTSSAEDWGFANPADGPGGSASHTPTGTTDGASPQGGFPHNDPAGQTAPHDGQTDNPTGIDNKGPAKVGTVTAVNDLTSPGLSEPPTTAPFGQV